VPRNSRQTAGKMFSKIYSFRGLVDLTWNSPNDSFFPPLKPCMYLYHCILIFLVSGHGVFATKPHARGSFLLEYPGLLMSEKEALHLPTQDYIYFFQWRGTEYA